MPKIETLSGRQPFMFTEVPGTKNLNLRPVPNDLAITIGVTAKTSHQDMGLNSDKRNYEGDSGRIAFGGQDFIGAQMFEGTNVLASIAVADGISTRRTGNGLELSGIEARNAANSTVLAGLETGKNLARADATDPHIIREELSDAVRGLKGQFQKDGIKEGDCTALFAVITTGPQGKKLHFAGAGDSQIMISYYDPSSQKVVVKKLFRPHTTRKGLLHSSARHTTEVYANTVNLQPYIDSGMQDIKVVICSDYLGAKIKDKELSKMIQPKHSPDKWLLIDGQRPTPFNALSRGLSLVLKRSRGDIDPGSRPGAAGLAKQLAKRDLDDGSFAVIGIPTN
jgi:serine/threonine protein phosphatase PrpC